MSMDCIAKMQIYLPLFFTVLHKLRVTMFKNKEAYQFPSLPFLLMLSYFKQITVNYLTLLRFLVESV